jgi:sortase A
LSRGGSTSGGQIGSSELLIQPRFMTRDNRLWQRAEKFLLIVGIILLAAYSIARLHGFLSSRLAMQGFDQARVAAGHTGAAGAVPETIDFSIWSPKRVQAYRESLTTKLDQPLAILRIPKLRIEVPVFEGTDDLTLNRGVGWIVGTAKIGELGNIGIAGHRDGFFRGLKDIQVGEGMELIAPARTIRYAVEQIEIVQPEDVGVLEDRGAPSLTLVTCFPFYFVGDAPQRFIVHARLLSVEGSTSLPGTISNQTTTKEKVN